MVSYNQKHNEANGENNQDGNNDNDSWNCGYEGETDDIQINTLRHKQIKNALSILMVSQGVPMILMGDEMGRTQLGNNNTYCHDNELNWLNWDLKEKNNDLFNFAKHIINFRRNHPVLRNIEHFRNMDYMNTGFPDISFHGTLPWQADWSPSNRVFAFMLDGGHAKNGIARDDIIYVAMNMYWESLSFELPQLPPDKNWHVSVNTAVPPPYDFHPLSEEPKIEHQNSFIVGPRSVIILIGR
jgi:isoamylase